MSESAEIRTELLQQECRAMEEPYRTIESRVRAYEQAIRNLTDKRNGYEQAYRFFCKKQPGYAPVDLRQAPFYTDIEQKIEYNERQAAGERTRLEGSNPKEAVFIRAILEERIPQAEEELLSEECLQADDFYSIKYYYGCFKSCKERSKQSKSLFDLCVTSPEFQNRARFARLAIEIEEYEEQVTEYYQRLDQIVTDFGRDQGDVQEIRSHGNEYLRAGRLWIDRGEQLKGELHVEDASSYVDRYLNVVEHQIRQVTSCCNAFESVQSLSQTQFRQTRVRIVKKIGKVMIAILLLCYLFFR
jgi:hypothetical protein